MPAGFLPNPSIDLSESQSDSVNSAFASSSSSPASSFPSDMWNYLVISILIYLSKEFSLAKSHPTILLLSQQPDDSSSQNALVLLHARLCTKLALSLPFSHTIPLTLAWNCRAGEGARAGIGENDVPEETNPLAIVPDNSPLDQFPEERRTESGTGTSMATAGSDGGEVSILRVKKEKVDSKILARKNEKSLPQLSESGDFPSKIQLGELICKERSGDCWNRRKKVSGAPVSNTQIPNWDHNWDDN